MKAFRTVETQRLYRLIADQISDKIRGGEFKLGERLPAERELAEKLGVSRSSIREALIALEIMGYVEVRVGTGVFVCSTQAPAESAQSAPGNISADLGPFDLLRTRMLLEPESAALAAQFASPEQLSRIREAYLAMGDRNPRRNGSLHEEDRAFHSAIATASGNSVLEATMQHLWDLCEASQMYRRLESHFLSRTVWQLAYEEHGRITSAILEQDPIRARNAMLGHLINISERLREDIMLNQSQPDGRSRGNAREASRPEQSNESL